MNISIFVSALSETEKRYLILELMKPPDDNPRIRIKNWIKFHRISHKLKSALNTMLDCGFIFIEQITKEELLKCRNCGIQTWEEFKTLRGF